MKRGHTLGSLFVATTLTLVCVGAIATGCNSNSDELQSEGFYRCDKVISKETDSWVVSFEQRIRDHDELFQYALQNYGAPDFCKGEITALFDGQKFGSITFRWKNSIGFSMKTLPPESSVIEFKHIEGFPDAVATKNVIWQYMKGRGFTVNSAKTRETATEAGRIEEYGAEPAGMNATIGLNFNNKNKLTNVTISTAL